MAAAKKTKQLAKQLFKLSVVNGQVSAEQVSGVLGWVEKTRPAQSLTLLKLYQRQIAAEIAKSEAVVTHAGPLGENVLAQVTAAMTKKYSRPVTAKAQLDSSLLAGLRVRVGNDIYESSVAGQLATLSV
ncbi:F0F1 ATP synthase subunit delta [Oleiharenicola lentus]|uniref:F0F1 ATP synthase subunit delta n=1 Tax=Oleiharenicola lentus TaxID=2508720 RepID=UPI003F66BB44